MAKEIPIVCSLCGVGCNLELVLGEDGIPMKSSCSGRNSELNGRYLCVKGFSIHEILTSNERLLHPLIRKDGKFERASWNEAIGKVADSLEEIINKYGSESVGMLCSGKILNEEAYLCQKFQRTVIGNNNIDNCARLCHGPSEVGLRKQLGFGAVSTFLEDYSETETFVIVGAHTAATHPVIWMRLSKRARQGETNIILADPRGTNLVKHAAVHLKVKPGTDIFWINALAKIIFSKGWHDENFCTHHTIGFRAYLKSLEDVDIDEACALAGVPREDLQKAGELINGRKTVFIWGMGLTQHSHGTNNVSAFINLVLLTGNIGKPGCGVSPLRGQNNVQGACDMGALPDLLPGHMLITDEAARLHMEAIWGAVIPSRPGLSAPEMIHKIASRKIRALYVVGENPIMSEPQASFVTWMMQNLDLLIVQDIFPTETSQHAHIVLPAGVVGEKEGTFTNAARRIQHTSAGVIPPGQTRSDWQILTDLAKAMGHDWHYHSTEEIWEEIRHAAPIFYGITYSRLQKSQGIFWPCYDESHPGTSRLYEEGFEFRDRRARFIPSPSPENLMVSTDKYPYVLITGRLLQHFNTGEMTRRSKKLLKSVPDSFVEMHPDDAKTAGIPDGEAVRITSPFGSVISNIRISTSVSCGYLFAPIHFSTPNFNTLMSSVPMDPQARMPALKIVPVNIERHSN